jgi:hypothetical protein
LLSSNSSFEEDFIAHKDIKIHAYDHSIRGLFWINFFTKRFLSVLINNIDKSKRRKDMSITISLENTKGCVIEEVMRFQEIYYTVDDFKKLKPNEIIKIFDQLITDDADQVFIASEVDDNPSIDINIGGKTHNVKINFEKDGLMSSNKADCIQIQSEDDNKDRIMICGWEKLQESKIEILDVNDKTISKAKELWCGHDHSEGVLDRWGHLELTSPNFPPDTQDFYMEGESSGLVSEKIFCLIDKLNNYHFIDLTKDTAFKSEENHLLLKNIIQSLPGPEEKWANPDEDEWTEEGW